MENNSIAPPAVEDVAAVLERLLSPSGATIEIINGAVRIACGREHVSHARVVGFHLQFLGLGVDLTATVVDSRRLGGRAWFLVSPSSTRIPVPCPENLPLAREVSLRSLIWAMVRFPENLKIRSYEDETRVACNSHDLHTLRPLFESMFELGMLGYDAPRDFFVDRGLDLSGHAPVIVEFILDVSHHSSH